jgi:hypothetical protein
MGTLTLTGLSPAAQKAVESARTTRRLYEIRLERQRERMKPGPYQRRSTIVIPSEWYSEEAAEFWKQIGAVWCPGHPDGQAWVLNWTTATHKGKHWSAEQWLTSIRRCFFEFWPSLKQPARRRCPACRQVFEAWHPEQQFCDDCSK